MGNIKEAHSTRAKLRNSRLTLGLLTYGAGDPNDDAMCSGVADVAQERDVNLICLPGKPLRSPIGFDAQANVLYDLISAETVDGLVIWGGALSHHVSAKEIQLFCERYRPLPMVSVALLLEGVPSILVDNYQGMRELVLHLIQTHGYRRIAFIRGPEGHAEAEARYRAYTETLTEHGLALGPDLVAPGEFKQSSGAAAIDLLLDERKLRPQVDFEAIVAADDDTAIGAIKALQARGIRVPRDVAVVGFDDIEEGRYITPPLTTVPFQSYEQGRRAAEMLLAQLQGESVTERVSLPTRPVVRQSCGCMSPAIAQARIGPATRKGTGLEERAVAEIVRAVAHPSVGVAAEPAERLVRAFSAELVGQSPDAFLSTLEDILAHEVVVGDDVALWQGGVSALRRHALPYLSDPDALPRAESLWHQARVMIGDMAERVRAHRGLQAQQLAQNLRQVGQALVTTFDVQELAQVICERLPELEIPSCYLAVYETPQAPTEWARLILAYDKGRRIELEPGGQRFRSRQLAPEGVLRRVERYAMVVEPLYFRQEQIGFAWFEAGPREGVVYETLRAQLSSALKGVLSFQQHREAEEALQHAYAEAEKRAMEQTVLNELAQALTTRLNVQEVLDEAYRQAARLVDATNFYIALYNPEKEELNFAIQVTESQVDKAVFSAPFSTEEGVSGYIIRHRTSVLIRDNLREWQEKTGVKMKGEPARSWLGVPLAVGDRVLGVMTVQSFAVPCLYDEHDRDLLSAIANVTAIALQNAQMVENLEQMIAERTAELKREVAERERLQQDVIEAQRHALQELSTPIIPLMDNIIVMPLIGSIDTMRSKDIMRTLLRGISQYRARVVILDITGVPIVDSGVANHLNKTIQAAQLKGARTIVTGMSDAVAEAVVDLGIDWSGIQTLGDMQTGLISALNSLGIKLAK